MESNTGAEDASNSILVVDAQIYNEGEPDDINQLPAVPTKGPVKSHADQVLEFEAKLMSQRVAATSSLQNVLKAVQGLRKDINDGHAVNSSLVTGQIDQIGKYK